ncbi:hypothetical protein N8I74_10890 [Chitiniphilus purpureus]|uniref:Uncharacterized protein n=1 Tax=Chitiniphilus purpureus TaxID=2981137 RepID=A0ABY6DPJ1_9NEIS|nr:hypothetical protein [Chitiniphilus sp. CD1]UXY13828.1 hypothetical protein N8I74_10890 [Chitiniphilus sp. CD1]
MSHTTEQIQALCDEAVRHVAAQGGITVIGEILMRLVGVAYAYRALIDNDHPIIEDDQK